MFSDNDQRRQRKPTSGLFVCICGMCRVPNKVLRGMWMLEDVGGSTPGDCPHSFIPKCHLIKARCDEVGGWEH